VSEVRSLEIVVIAGPNGAGKSTLARFLLPEAMPFLNADEIAKTLPVNPDGSVRDFEAGRELLRRMEALVADRRSFAIETTLASRSLAARIAALKGVGYRLQLLFFAVPDVELSLARVAARVRRGGHAIPEATIRRRFVAGPRYFTELYQPLAHHWMVLQNWDAGGPQCVRSGFAPGATPSSSLFDDETEVMRRAGVAVREALLDHRFVGNPVPVWRDGRVILIAP